MSGGKGHDGNISGGNGHDGNASGGNGHDGNASGDNGHSNGGGGVPINWPQWDYEFRDGVHSENAPDCRCEHNVIYPDHSVVQAWVDPLTFVIGASPFVVYPISLFLGKEYNSTDLLTSRVVGSYASLAYLFSLNEDIQNAWGTTIATDLSTLPRS